MFIVQFSCIGQTNNSLKLPSEKTEHHIDIPLYKFSIIPPDSTFHLSKQFSGIQSASENCDFIFTLLNTPFDQLPGDPGSDYSISEQTEFQEAIHTENMHGTIYKFKPVEDWRFEEHKTITWILAIGDASQTYGINVYYSDEMDTVLNNTVRTSLESLFYDANENIDPFALSDFSLNIQNTGFKFAGLLYGMLYFNTTGKTVNESQEDLNLMINTVPVAATDSSQQEEFIQSVVKVDDKNIISRKIKTISGIQGMEVIAKDENSIEYNLILFTKTKAYLITGITNKSKPDDLNKIINFVDTFSIKQ